MYIQNMDKLLFGILILEVSIIDAIKKADMFASKAIIWPLFYAGAFYLLFVGLLTILFNFIEKKLSYYKV